MRRVASWALCVVVGCSGAPARPSAPPAAGTLSLEDFFAREVGAAVPVVCADPEHVMRRCFRVTEDECQQYFALALHECFEAQRSSLPQTVSDANAAEVATPIGECAGDAYGRGLRTSGRYIDGCE